MTSEAAANRSSTDLNQMKPPTLSSTYVGHVDHVASGNIGGWVVDTRAPDRSVGLEVILEKTGKIVGSGETGVPREDVDLIYPGGKAAGFSIPIDTREFRSLREVLVRVKGTNIFLPPVPALTAPKKMLIELANQAKSALDSRDDLIAALSGNTAALIALNNDERIRLKVDPGIGNIFIINGARGMASEHFRTFEAAAALRRLGYSPLIYDVEDVPWLHSTHALACIFVRVAMDSAISKFIAQLKRDGVRVIADLDDLVFRPSLMHKIDGVRFLTSEEKARYRQGMLQYRELLLNTDLVTVTTPNLATAVSETGAKPFVLRNYPLHSARVAADNLSAKVWPDQFTIGYYSGTLTHQADFKTCSLALASFLRRYPDAKLRIVGELNLAEFHELGSLASQIQTRGMLPYSEMISDIATCSMVIAPLEIGNEFCEAKSELKFFDAALSGTPVAASATETFRDCIQHGTNGFLASTSTEWAAIFETCYMDRRLLTRCGDAARERAAIRYGISAQTDNFHLMLCEVGISQPIPKGKGEHATPVVRSTNKIRKTKTKSLAVLLPDIMIGSGGHRKVLTFCREYVRAGGKVEICFLSGRSDSELQSIVQTYYYSDCGDIRAYNGIPPSADVAVATSWPTAYEVSEWDAPEKYYFVQDFEPLFNPMSSDYAQALHSYRLGLRLISFGRWNAQKLKHDLGLESAVIDFPLDHEVYFPAAIKREKEILFYARPSQPRRLYELGLAAIDIVRPFAPDWRFTFFGESVDLQGRQGIQSLGRITDLGELSRIYSQAKIGIAFSTTNPSLIPFEMLACGLPVVDVELGYEAVDFDECTAIVKSAPVPKQLARTLLSLIGNEERLSTLSREAADWARKRPTEAAFGRSVIQSLNLG